MDSDGPIYICFYGGTGIGKLLHPLGERYYGQLLRGIGIEGVIECPELFSLPWAGLLDYPIRHAGINRLQLRKLGKNVRLIVVGHSQGALEAELQALRHPELVVASIGISGPYSGSPLAGPVGRILPQLKGLRQMAPGSAQLREIEWRCDQLGLVHRHDDPGRLPELHRIAVGLDVLVPASSAWHVVPGYPSELVFRYLLSHRQHAPEGVELIRAAAWHTGHVGEIFAPQLIELIARIVRRHAGERLVA